MRLWLGLGVLFLVGCGAASAQEADANLAVTLPSGKVVHFQSEEQKAKYEAARAARAARMQSAQTPPAAPSTPKPPEMGRTALDEPPSMKAKVNPTAPTFTADYYMVAPESWVGKQITLSVAFVHVLDDTKRPDGLRQMEALTYNDMTGAFYGQASGGYLVVLAQPEVALRLMQQCGTNYQYNGGRVKTTLIRGEIRKYDKLGSYVAPVRPYGFYVEK